MSQEQPRERDSRFFQLMPALIGLLGVLVGAAATSGVTYLGDHRRAKADERAAERLVLAEILSDDHALTLVAPRLTDTAWHADRDRLARWLSNTEWAWVAKYYRDLPPAGSRISPAQNDRLRGDASCALAALNVWLYSGAPRFESLRSDSECKKPPPGAL